MRPDARPLAAAGTVLGIGLGSVFDGILFHQILHTHRMLPGWLPKTSLPSVEVDVFWDGLFPACTWIATVVGVAMLFRVGEHAAVRWSRSLFVGALLFGWGLFNVVEDTIDRHLLQVHHLVESAGLSGWDWAFLGSGVGLMMLAWWRMRAADRDAQGAPGALHPWPVTR